MLSIVACRLEVSSRVDIAELLLLYTHLHLTLNSKRSSKIIPDIESQFGNKIISRQF